MPDCESDGKKLEDLLTTLISPTDPLWPHAQNATDEAARLVDDANSKIRAGDRSWKRFAENSRIKAEIRSWLAWQIEPGASFGTAINSQVLGHDSPQAISFIRWIKNLYGFTQIFEQGVDAG